MKTIRLSFPAKPKGGESETCQKTCSKVSYLGALRKVISWKRFPCMMRRGVMEFRLASTVTIYCFICVRLH
ncbi:hypothetical protein SLEP1_g44762 [Rubroshorea leprosula]|uniref:Uncharacterized protein n=1 Tax=Rubroshorea leprosula TaxID=152421 RepID=A0AAV5LIK1_9ROSI|nr:hypothetical protein SLEP1_g44762 [Rubroshorea leprosula]